MQIKRDIWLAKTVNVQKPVKLVSTIIKSINVNDNVYVCSGVQQHIYMCITSAMNGELSTALVINTTISTY